MVEVGGGWWSAVEVRWSVVEVGAGWWSVVEVGGGCWVICAGCKLMAAWSRLSRAGGWMLAVESYKGKILIQLF